MADNAVINIVANILPDDIRTAISGTTTYNLNDIGNNNRWLRWITLATTTAASAVDDSAPYIMKVGGVTASVDKDVDDLGLIIIKHSGYQTTEGGTASTDNLYININHGVDASGGAGDILLKPGEIWYARLVHSDLADISLEASANNIRVYVYAIADDGGV